MVILDTHLKNLNKRSFWPFYLENILQWFSSFKEKKYLESIDMLFQMSFNVYLD